MRVNIQCPICKKTNLTVAVEPFRAQAEYSTHCPHCGPVSGVVFFTIEQILAAQTNPVAL
jgi:uncharacterized Zn finger protein